MDVKQLTETLTKKLTDEGLLVEAGWMGFAMAVMSPTAPHQQYRDMHGAFFAGALHLYSSIMTFLDSDEEPTEADMTRMENIAKELRKFGEYLEREMKSRGH